MLDFFIQKSTDLHMNKRILLPKDGVYHCISRIVAGERLLDAVALEQMMRQLWKVADFCGVEILCHCLLSNHLHILVRVPGPGPVESSEMARRCAVLYGLSPSHERELARFLATGSEKALCQRQKLEARMGTVSNFLKEFKHRFSIWFNRHRARFGTLWAERFRSVIVEDDPFTVRTVAAYICLNPVRAGLCEDPKDYRFCSYAEAVAGHPRARQGLLSGLRQTEWKSAHRHFRIHLFATGSAPRQGKAAISDSKRREVLAEEGALPGVDLLHSRARHFSMGLVLGTKQFMDNFIGDRPGIVPTKRRTGPKPLGGDDRNGLFVLRGRN